MDAGVPFSYGAWMNEAEPLIDTLPPLWRLALAYAPAVTRGKWLTLLALDVRLAGVVRAAREPILAQMRLAWWRDRLRDRAANWPKGEPLLAAMACWGDEHGALIALVDGWEALLGDAPLSAETLAQWVEGRVSVCQAMAQGDARAARMARGWALADLATHLGHPDEVAAIAGQVTARDWRAERLPRGMRPLAILHGVAARGRGDRDKGQKISMLTLMRLGIFGI